MKIYGTIENIEAQTGLSCWRMERERRKSRATAVKILFFLLLCSLEMMEDFVRYFLSSSREYVCEMSSLRLQTMFDTWRTSCDIHFERWWWLSRTFSFSSPLICCVVMSTSLSAVCQANLTMMKILSFSPHGLESLRKILEKCSEESAKLRHVRRCDVVKKFTFFRFSCRLSCVIKTWKISALFTFISLNSDDWDFCSLLSFIVAAKWNIQKLPNESCHFVTSAASFARLQMAINSSWIFKIIFGRVTFTWIAYLDMMVLFGRESGVRGN